MGRSLVVSGAVLVAAASALGKQRPASGEPAPVPPQTRRVETPAPRPDGQVLRGMSGAFTNMPPTAPRPEASVEPPKEVPPAAKIDPPTGFETGSLRLKYGGGNWQLWAGPILLKDFGRAEAEANEALQVFRDLRVNSRGSIGGVFEYWLSDGEAPSGLTRHRKAFDFQPERLRVQQVSGGWCLRDDRIILYNFGPSKADAEAALAVCQKYGFNQLGYVGHPTPILKYPMIDPRPRDPNPGPPPLVPASARMQAQELAHRPLVIPEGGMIGTSQRLEFRRLELRKDRGEWCLVADQTTLGTFGSFEREGRVTLQALQQFRCTDACRIGDSGFGFFLSNGRAPQGTIVGIPSRPLKPDALTVRQVGGNWAVCEGQRPLVDFGGKSEDAKHALAAIKHYQFDTVCMVGAGHLNGLMLFVKAR
jgi:hypothetical protein